MDSEWCLTVNGSAVTVRAPTDMPLLWVLRDSLGLTGAKYGCGIAKCGACLVKLNGDAVPACVTTISDASGGVVLTVEGLSPDRTHPVQRAWLTNQVPQCGYCQPGQLIAAAVLLEKNPAPTDADIDHAMSRVLCRCGTYQRIRTAIRTLVNES